jgi:hypothetical protein
MCSHLDINGVSVSGELRTVEIPRNHRLVSDGHITAVLTDDTFQAGGDDGHCVLM